MARADDNPKLAKLLDEIRTYPSGKCKECKATVPGRVWHKQRFIKLCQQCMTKNMGKEYTCTTCNLYPCDGLNDLVYDYIRVICWKCLLQLPRFEAWVKSEYSAKMRKDGYPKYHENWSCVHAKDPADARQVMKYPGAWQLSKEELDWKVVSITKMHKMSDGQTLEEIEKDYAILI